MLQLINVVLWTLHCEMNLFKYEAVEYGMMVYVGLLGGAMYVNCAYSLLSDKEINNKDRELCMNLMALWVNMGVTMSSVVEVITDNTVFSDLIAKSHSGDSEPMGCGTLGS